ncbi:hypothetical protein L596_023095 [Steinernema carpocapsae]|uniref:Uncharacterized protein n=1 Tax=Steinernema carpocapsae TaxID=34508 RepID=A0A4U5MDF3_STECR|nr:hypothetical protein L596_023095 [Steinernema carpocapsae]
MNSVPFEFASNVLTLLKKKLDFPGLWNKDLRTDRKQFVTLYLDKTENDSCKYHLRCIRTGTVLSAWDRSAWNNCEIGLILNLEQSHPRLNLTSKVAQNLAKFISCSQRPIDVYLSHRYSDVPEVNVILEAVPRFSTVKISYFLWSHIYSSAIEAQRVQYLQMGLVCMTEKLFYEIWKFTGNCNFRGISLRVSHHSRVPYETVYRLFCEREKDFACRGRRANLCPGRTWFSSFSSCHTAGYRSEELSLTVYG